MTKILFVDLDFDVIDKSLLIEDIKQSLFVNRQDIEKIIEKNNCSEISLDFSTLYKNSGLLAKCKSILNYGYSRYSRFAKYDIKDIPSIFQKLLNIAFYLKKEKISRIVFANIPHELPEYLICITASLLSIETLSFYQVCGYLNEFSSVHQNAIINENLLYNFELDAKNKIAELIDYYLSGKFSKPFYLPQNNKLQNQTQLKNIIDSYKFILKSIKRLSFTEFSHSFGRMILNIKSLSYYKKSFIPDSIKEIKEDYIYLPLQNEPELASAVFHDNQIITSFEIILAAREKFDNSIQIVCKENPAQLLFNRSPSFFKLISSLENVLYLQEGSHDYLIKNCLALVLGRGTPGYEGLILEKPIFGLAENWYYGDLIKNLFSEDKFSYIDIMNLQIPDKENIISSLSKNLHNIIMKSASVNSINDFNINKNTRKFSKILNLWLNKLQKIN